MKFKLLDPILWTSIKKQIDDDLGPGVTDELVGDLVPVSLMHGEEMSIYLCSMDWVAILEQGVERFELSSLGLYLGDIVNKQFRLSISVLYLLAPLTTNRIIISGKGAGSFTYGKSILKESVLEVSEGLKKGQRVIVLNVDRDCLGLATMTTNEYRIDRMRPNDLVAKNLADIGLYFRKYF